MAAPALKLKSLQPLRRLRLRPRSAYRGTITEPGPLVSDGKVLFVASALPEAAEPLAADLCAHRDGGRRAEHVTQEEAAAVFDRIARQASKRARVLGQCAKPVGVPAAEVDRVAVLRYGRGGSTRYVFTDAHRLRLLQALSDSDEIRCDQPQAPVLLVRQGIPVAALTALEADLEVRR